MSNKSPEQNNCENLHNNESYKEALDIYHDICYNNGDPFQYMLNMQYDLQVSVAGKNPEMNQHPDELITLRNKFDWLRENKQAFDDEYREILDALPGIDTPVKDRSALWKRWKAKFNEIGAKTFDDLSEKEMKELKYELCDSFHFYMNMFFALDMDAKEMFVYYYFKNAENHKRVKNGY